MSDAPPPQGIIRATLGSLAKMLSVRDDQVEDALQSEKLVKRTIDRRGFFKAATTAVAAVALPKGFVLDEPRSFIMVDGCVWSSAGLVCPGVQEVMIAMRVDFLLRTDLVSVRMRTAACSRQDNLEAIDGFKASHGPSSFDGLFARRSEPEPSGRSRPRNHRASE